MKISKSKQELARIISENGGWRDGAESAAQCKSDNAVSFYRDIPYRDGDYWWGEHLNGCDIGQDRLIANWHQTILSRAEYFHLYPAPDADGWIEWKGGECPVDEGTLIDVRYRDGQEQVGCECGVWRSELYGTHYWLNSGRESNIIAYRLHKTQAGATDKLSSEAVSAAKIALMSDSIEELVRSIPEPEINSKNINITQVDDINVVESEPTIEQLAADYRNAKDYAGRKQQEADAAKADVEAKLKALELAGEALGLLVSPITTKQEPALVIAVQVGDEVECVKSNINRDKYMGRIGTVSSVDVDDTSTPYLVDFGGEAKIWCHEVKFIRRP